MKLRLVIDVNLSPEWVPILAHAGRPSLVQLRGPKVLPEQIAEPLVESLRRFRADLESGALLLIEPGRSRVRILPL